VQPPVSTRIWMRRPPLRPQGVLCAVAAVVMLASATAVTVTASGRAAAAPQPGISQVRQKLNHLRSQQDQAIQQYDQAKQALVSAQRQLTTVTASLRRDRAQFQSMRTQIAQLAAAAYMNGTLTSEAALLTSARAGSAISQAAMISHLSADQAAEVRQLVASARQLTSAQQAAARTELAVASLEKQARARKQAVTRAVARERSLLARLTAQQRAAMLGTGTTTAVYTGPTTTQAGKAVAFAYAQLGKPYEWGATGPDAYDCSGLVQAAWAAAGVSIPRTTYEQWAALPHVPMSAIQPGDLIFFDAEGHVAIYVGSNMIIDAPQPGESVEKISLSSSWYAANLDGAARP
jgi:cell wall-associated NlpC family hydrolase